MHNPIRVAEQAAVADLISNGRALYGFANGYRDVEFDGFGLRRKDRGARLTEQFEILRQAWTQDRVNFSGKHFKYSDLAVTPKPLQKPYPPVFVGTSPVYGPAVERAGRFGFGILVPPTLSPAQCHEAVEIWKKAARAAGHNVEKLRSEKIAPMGVCYDVSVDETNHKAEGITSNLRYLYREQLGGWRFLVDSEGKGVAFDRPDILNSAVESVVNSAAIGSPAKVIRMLRKYEEAGIDFFCARVRWDSTPRVDLHRCIRLLAEEVIPAFK